MTILAALVLAIWLGLVATGFWTCREADDNAPFAAPDVWPEVVAVVPARDEADVIERSIASLLRQDYAGPFRIVLVDDNSGDGTGDLARALATDRLTVLRGSPLAVKTVPISSSSSATRPARSLASQRSIAAAAFSPSSRSSTERARATTAPGTPASLATCTP